ncbi:MAG: cytochrome c oxidase assembly protein [Alphaproteobacteria bacterium]|nr:cytochrome c oxidase assembly protein [Alphaproteobacteria bacterium]
MTGAHARRNGGFLPARRTARLVVAVFLALLPGVAWAHGDHEGPVGWGSWNISPEITGGLLLMGLIYGAGLRKARGSGEARKVMLHVAFYGGLVAFFIALQSPVEVLADHIFFMHQIEHMLLRTIGPMLVMLALPQAMLTRGLPRGIRRSVVSPVLDNGGVRGLFGFLTQPVVVTLLFVGVSLFWMIPSYHDRAILNEPVHYTWHLTLMITGLLFFWRLFDPREQPAGASLATRLVMFWTASMGNILLGVYLSLKSTAIYHAYGILGRPWAIDPVRDERFGGLTMWIPGCMMFGAAALLLVHRWQAREERNQTRRMRVGGDQPVMARDFLAARRPQNRMLAFWLGGFVLLVLIIAVSVAVLYDQTLAPHPYIPS